VPEIWQRVEWGGWGVWLAIQESGRGAVASAPLDVGVESGTAGLAGRDTGGQTEEPGQRNDALQNCVTTRDEDVLPPEQDAAKPHAGERQRSRFFVS